MEAGQVLLELAFCYIFSCTYYFVTVNLSSKSVKSSMLWGTNVQRDIQSHFIWKYVYIIYTSNPYKEILLKLAACLCAGRTLYILSTSSSLGANVDFFWQEHGQISGFLGQVFADHLAIALQQKTQLVTSESIDVNSSVLGFNSFLEIGEVSICFWSAALVCKS